MRLKAKAIRILYDKCHRSRLTTVRDVQNYRVSFFGGHSVDSRVWDNFGYFCVRIYPKVLRC